MSTVLLVQASSSDDEPVEGTEARRERVEQDEEQRIESQGKPGSLCQVTHQVMAEADEEHPIVYEKYQGGSSQEASVVEVEGQGVVREGVRSIQNEGEKNDPKCSLSSCQTKL